MISQVEWASQAAANDVNQLPLVTVIMPVRNEARYIERSLMAVLNQDYPSQRMQILVADGMSTDGTREIVQALLATRANLLLIDNPGRIVPKAINRAMEVAHGDIIVRIDGHCEIGSDYLRLCVQHFRQTNVDGVGGPIVTVGETPVAQVIAAAMGSVFGVGNATFRTRHGVTRLVDTIAFPAYRRDAIELAGDYDEELVRNQDDEYNYRLRKLGAKLLLAADLNVRYYSRSSLGSLWRQYFQYGYWKVRVVQKHPRQMRARHFVPAAFVGSVCFAALFSAISASGLWLLGVILGIYVLANAIASVSALRKEQERYCYLLPFAFATLHCAYGSGFLVGLLRFWNQWRWPRIRQYSAGVAQRRVAIR